MVELEQQTFTPVQKAESEKVVITEGRQWSQHDIDQAETAWPIGGCHLSTQGRVAVHMVKVVAECGIRVVN